MNSLRSLLPLAHQYPYLWTGIRAFSSSSSSDFYSLRKSVASLLDALSLKQGQTLVQNCGDSDVGKIVIELAKERKVPTISIIGDKPGTPETVEELKALGGDIVVPESYTKTWSMKRVVNETSPSAGINFSDGYQATAVGKAVVDGGTLVSYRKKLLIHINSCSLFLFPLIITVVESSVKLLSEGSSRREAGDQIFGANSLDARVGIFEIVRQPNYSVSVRVFSFPFEGKQPPVVNYRYQV